MKIEFNDHWELRQFCKDLSRRLEASEDKVRELQRQKDALTSAVPQPYGSETHDILVALARDFPEALRGILRKMSPDNRIMQIKTMRTVFSVGLKEGKEFVDGAPLKYW